MPNVNLNRKVKAEQHPVVIGQVFANDYASSGWTTAGAGTTWTFNASSIRSAGTTGAITSFIRYNKWTLQSERFTIKALVTINSVSASDKWFSLGLAGVSTFSQLTNFQCAYWAESGANNGLTTIYNNNGTQVATSGVARITSIVGDQIEYTVTFEYNTVTFSVRNMNNPNTYQTISWLNSSALQEPGGAAVALPNINQVAFNNFYGDYTVNTFDFTDNQYKNIYLNIIGDSKSEGYRVQTLANRFSNLIEWKTGGMVQLAAGSGNVTQDILNNMPEILSQKAKYVMLFIGRNDIANGVAAGTWQANYLNIVKQLEGNGTVVYHQLPLTETVLNQSALTTYINTTFEAKKIIPIPSGWSTTTDLSSDGIHLSIQGADKVYQNALIYIPSPNAGYNPPLQSNLQTWYNTLSVKPSQSVLNDLNDLFQGVENDTDLVEIDFLHPVGGLETDEQRLAPIKTSGTTPMVAVNSPTLDVNGVTGNGTTSYLNTKWNPSTNGVKFTQNSGSMFNYNRTNRIQNGTVIMGCYGGGVFLRMCPFNTTLMLGTINAVGDSTSTTSASQGFLFAQRTTSILTTLYRNTTTLGTDSDVSGSPNNLEVYVCGANSSGSLANQTTDNTALIGFGSGIVSESRLEYRVRKYMTARGINV